MHLPLHAGPPPEMLQCGSEAILRTETWSVVVAKKGVPKRGGGEVIDQVTAGDFGTCWWLLCGQEVLLPYHPLSLKQ